MGASGIIRLVFRVYLALSALCVWSPDGTAAQPISSEHLAHAADYGFMWWPYGWRGRSPEGRRVFCVQTNRYGLAFDVDRATLTHLGRITGPLAEREAVSQSNEVVFSLPPVSMPASLQIGARTYRLVTAAPRADEVRIIEHGRFLQRIEILNARFEDDDRRPLDGVEAQLELVCWPDRAAILLRVQSNRPLEQASLSMGLRASAEPWRIEPLGDRARLLHEAGAAGGGLAVLRPPGAVFAETAGGSGGIEVRMSPERWAPDLRHTLALIVLPFGPSDSIPVAERIRQELAPRDDTLLKAVGREPYRHPLEVAFDPFDGCYRVRLADAAADGWTPARNLDLLERIGLACHNPDDRARTVRLLFAKEDFPKIEGIPGMMPMLRDSQGRPTGLPVQISKNWHVANWFHGSTMLCLPPKADIDLEFAIAYGRWGRVPPVSHAQLCLVGWGGNQLWHEVALGCFGEAICYDPDVNLERAVIDDIRPLMVRPMGKPRRDAPRWGWTNNVGGGDFLVLVNPAGERQYLTRMRSAYLRYGPNLSEVVLAGVTPDRAIDARMTLFHYASDDVTRGIYRVRYAVRKPVAFSRLALFQLGADQYNDHQFRKIARGHIGGLVEEWTPEPAGMGYDRAGIPCEGPSAWISLHEAVPPEGAHGAWANRGMVIREWKARLGGRDQPVPLAGVYRTRDKYPSVLVELTPPPDVKRLEPGDFVEACIELVVLPISAADYLGPNDALRKALTADGNTWRMVWREAAGNHLTVDVSRGRLETVYPARVRCDEQGRAAFRLRGGVGYLPLTFTGVRDRERFILERESPEGWTRVAPSVASGEFWQADYQPAEGAWDLTFTVPADGNSAPDGVAFRLSRAREPEPVK